MESIIFHPMFQTNIWVGNEESKILGVTKQKHKWLCKIFSGRLCLEKTTQPHFRKSYWKNNPLKESKLFLSIVFFVAYIYLRINRPL